MWILNTHQGDINTLSHEALLDLLIVRPLQINIDGNHPFSLIVLDGIDLLEEVERNVLVNKLLNQSSLLPDYIGFLYTARQSIAVNSIFASNEIFTILPNDKNTKNDIKNYLREALPSLSDKVYNKLSNRCHGSFLFAHFLAKFIKDGGMDIDTIHPGEIYRLYLTSMKRIVSDIETFRVWEGALSLLSQFNHIPVSVFKDAMKWNDQKYSLFRKQFLSLTEITCDSFEERVISFVYPSFSTWLCQQNHEYQVTSTIGVELMKSLFINLPIKDLHRYLLLCIKDIFRYDQNALLSVARDEMIIKRILEEGEKCLSDSRHFFDAESYFIVCESLATIAGNNILLKIKLPFYRAKRAFIAGEFQTCSELLLPCYNSIEDRLNHLDALYMLGTSCDILGKRKDATTFFLELLKATEANSNHVGYYIKALCGLLWLDHFNNLTDAQEHFNKLRWLKYLSPSESILRDLIMARHLLSIGELKNSLDLFSKMSIENASVLWKYDSISCRNQMLLIESLVACFDNNLYDRGIEIGKEILSHLEGHGSIAECYCSSWIAINCIFNGLIDQANFYLIKSKEMNQISGNDISAWMSMHLTSVQAFLETEKGNFDQAIELHQKVLIYANSCHDTWVAGDALFELFFLLFPNLMQSHSKLKEISITLNKLAHESNLPHLKYKSALVNAFLYGNKIEDVILCTLDKVAKGSLPSVDEVRSFTLCLQLPINDNYRKELETKLKESIDTIIINNPNGKYIERPFIKNIIKQMSYEC